MGLGIRTAILDAMPPRARRALHNARDWSRLERLPRQPFSVGNLRALASVDLGAVMTAPEATGSWAEVSPSIDAVFPATDRYGGVNPGDRRALYHLVRYLRPQRVLEVGTHVGASTLHIALALQHNGNGGTVDTVDVVDVNCASGPWSANGLASSPAGMLEALSCRDVVHFHNTTSFDFLKRCQAPYDLIFLDGDHAAPTVYREVAKALPRLGPNGLILLHDYYPGNAPLYPGLPPLGGPWRGATRIRRECSAIAVVPLGQLPWETKLGVKATSLALLGRA